MIARDKCRQHRQPVERTDVYMALFGQDREAAEAKFLELSEKLEKFFAWRGAPSPEDLAQETLGRVISRLQEGCIVPEPANFMFGVAKNVLREQRREYWRTGRHDCDLDTLDAIPCSKGTGETELLLWQCLKHLQVDDRELLVRYHSGEQDALRRELKVDPNHLRVRVHRVIRRLRFALRHA